VKGLYSLMILNFLMSHIRQLELTFTDGKGEINKAPSSFFPCQEPPHVSHIQPSAQEAPSREGHFLPCHYFDYICGTSTGRLVFDMPRFEGIVAQFLIVNILKSYSNHVVPLPNDG